MRVFRFSAASRNAPRAFFLMLLAACQDGRPPLGAAAKGTELPEPPSVRFVKLEEVTEWTGQPWAAIAEFNLMDSTGADLDRRKWTVTADNGGANDFPKNAIDGDPKTLWHSRWEGPEAAPPPPHWLVVKLDAPVKVSGFRYLPRQDGNANGAIAQYRFYVSDDGLTWGKPVSTGDFTSMGNATIEKVVVFAKQTENHVPVATAPSTQNTSMGQAVSVQVSASDADDDQLSYAATGLPPGLGIAPKTGLIAGTPIVPGSYRVNVSVSDNKGPPSTFAFQWTVQAPSVTAREAKLLPGEVRFVKLEEVSEINKKPWASMAEFNLIGASGANLQRSGWIVSADSADTSDKPANAIDGHPATLWHSQWDGASPPPPHSFIIDMRQGAKVSGFRYLPRQDGSSNGTIARFRLYMSIDGVDWGKPVAEGDFSAMGAPQTEKTVMLR